MISKDRVVLQKIMAYAFESLQYIGDLTFEIFMSDKKTISACAFTLSQIGEVAKYISQETQDKYKNVQWKSIKGMRNKIVHDYDNIDYAVLWGTIKTSLPQLVEQIRDILHTEADEYNESSNLNIEGTSEDILDDEFEI